MQCSDLNGVDNSPPIFNLSHKAIHKVRSHFDGELKILIEKATGSEDVGDSFTSNDGIGVAVVFREDGVARSRPRPPAGGHLA